MQPLTKTCRSLTRTARSAVVKQTHEGTRACWAVARVSNAPLGLGGRLLHRPWFALSDGDGDGYGDGDGDGDG
jgi:hypothetical protein